jgi:hypothetical protein
MHCLSMFSEALSVIVYGLLINIFVTRVVYADIRENVVIKNCNIFVGDDGIAIKSGWDQYGIAYGHPSANIIIQNVIIRSMVR